MINISTRFFQVIVHNLDLSSLESIKDCANVLLESEEKIDILINNAGNILNIY